MKAANPSEILPLRILIVEDDELFRLGLSTRFQREPSVQIVAEATDSESAIALTNKTQPDVVLLDIGLPGIGGVEACHHIKQQHPDLPVLVLTAHSQKPLIEALIAAGASGFCLKGIEAEALFLALRSVAVGASWWDQRSTKEIRTAYASQKQANQTTESVLPPEAKHIDPLTPREQEILTLIAKGHNNREIAEQLNITTGTTRVHVHAILRKLNVRDRTQAAISAIQAGFDLS
ncbi:MAG: response regulator transcription factor [Cyanobacteria bacterium J06650_10]